jgi:hypothetical protein
MNRRRFLKGTAAAGVGAIAGLGQLGAQGQPAAGQAPAGQPPAAGQAQGGRGGRGGGRGGPANVPPARLARIAMMTLNHGAIMRTPWAANPTPNQTMSVLDLPQYYVDTYGIRDIEFQHGHLAKDTTNPDPEFFKEMKAKLDAAGSRANQINIEIGTMAQMGPDGKAAALSGEARANWLATGKKWVDVAPIIGIKRLMLNQGALTDDSKAGVMSLWKELQDYARPKQIMISAETRGSGPPQPGRGGRGAQPGAPPPPPPPPAPAMPEPQRIRYVTGILNEVIEGSGGYWNLDFGGAGRFRNQQQLHEAIKVNLKRTSGSMHIKSSPDWDIGLAVRYAESIGYKGLYTIEVNPDPAIRIVYNIILAALA